MSTATNSARPGSRVVGREVLPGGPPAALTEQRHDVVVFACGDPAHGEHDSIAIAAAVGLPPALLEQVDLKLTGAMRPEYLRDLAPATQVILADTVPGAAAPGEVLEVPLVELSGLEEPLAASATADPPLDEIVAMAQLLRDKPIRGRFVGLGVDSEDLTTPPDADRVATLRGAIERVVAELEAG